MPEKSSKSLPPKFPIADAVHLILGDSPGGTLRQAGARFTVSVRDTLAYGPSSFDPAEHRRLRYGFWTEEGGLDSSDLGNVPIAAPEVDPAVRAFPSGLPLVVWSGENWSDRLFLWWVLDAVSRTRLADRPLWLASPLCVPEWNFLESMGCYNADQMKLMFRHGQVLGPGAVKAAVGRWRRFCEGTPKGLAELGTPRQPWLAVSTDYLRFFPTGLGKTVRLSEFDAALLGGFSPHSWRRPLDLFSSERMRKHPVLLNHGDFLPLLRLEAWTHSGPLPVLIRRETGEEREYTRYEYQLTGHGVRVLNEGLGRISWGPPLEMGGHAAYATKRPWVARETQEGWRLRPL
jgi:hypothetical protein